jgi:hypothetical protein
MKLASLLSSVLVIMCAWYSQVYSATGNLPQISSIKSRDIIKSVVLEGQKVTIQVEDTFKKRFLRDDFFVEYEQDIDLSTMDESILTLPFILNVISIIWSSGEDYYIEKMDKDMYHSLILIKRVVRRLYPKTSWEGRLIPRTLVTNSSPVLLKDPAKEFALFFSGGLDSTSSALTYHDKSLLLITARGQWDVPLGNDLLWQQRENGFREFAKRYGHTNSFVRSNFAEFLNWSALDNLSSEIASWRLDTVEGIGMFGLAAPILYSKGYSLVRMAASYTWTYPWPSAANPLVDNNLCMAGAIKFEHDQFEYSRADKIENIINLANQGLIDRPILKVCDGRRAANCDGNDCSKCVPTAFTILTLGEDPNNYGFDTSHEEVIERMKRYLAVKQLYWTLWELQDLKVKLRQRGNVSKDIAWFMNMDLSSLIDAHYLKEKEIVNWNEFRHLAPASVKIPKVSTKILK